MRKKLLIMMCAMIMLFCSALTVSAEETSTAITGSYSYRFYADQGTIGPNYSREWSHIYDGTFTTNYQACFIFSEIFESEKYPEIKGQYGITYFLPEYATLGNANVVVGGSFESKLYDKYSTKKGTLQEDKTVTVELTSVDFSFVIGTDGTFSTNIPIFENKDDALAYFLYGDTSGMLNDIYDGMLEDETFGLTGFTATSNTVTLTASWTGTTHDDLIDTYNKAKVGIRPGYAYKSAPGQIAVRDLVYKEVDIADKKWTELYTTFTADDENLFLRYLEFIPNYQIEPLSTVYKGKSCFVWLNADGTVEKIVNDYVSEESEYDVDIPTPKVVMTGNGYEFGFNNATDEYYIEMQGRWYSVDDIELYKENLMWKYKYSTLLKTDLNNWILKADKKKAAGTHDLSKYGSETFETLLSTYPIDSRNYSGGTNAVGDYFSGYNDALDTLKMLLNQPTSLYNGVEIYVRYYTINEMGNVKHGKWCHWFDDLADSDGSSGSDVDDDPNGGGNGSEDGLDDDEKDDLEDGDDSRNDDDVAPDNPEDEFDDIDFSDLGKKLLESIGALFVYVKNLPSLIASCFSFLPPWVLGFIGLGIIVAVLMRIFGR